MKPLLFNHLCLAVAVAVFGIMTFQEQENKKPQFNLDKPFYGILTNDLTDELRKDIAKRNGKQPPAGECYAILVLESSNAAKSGMKKDDVIVKVGGVKVKNALHCAELLNNVKLEDEVELEYFSGTETKSKQFKWERKKVPLKPNTFRELIPDIFVKSKDDVLGSTDFKHFNAPPSFGTNNIDIYFKQMKSGEVKAFLRYTFSYYTSNDYLGIQTITLKIDDETVKIESNNSIDNETEHDTILLEGERLGLIHKIAFAKSLKVRFDGRTLYHDIDLTANISRFKQVAMMAQIFIDENKLK